MPPCFLHACSHPRRRPGRLKLQRHDMRPILLSLLLAVNLPAATATFEIGPDSFLLNGQPFVIRVGEIHSARVPREYWQHRLQMAKAMGLNTVCAYLFWNHVEPREGRFDWSGMADIAEFCRLAQAEGLWVILRPGPYACAEWEMGGLPWWLLKHEDIQLRTRDPRFLAATRRYLMEVGRQLAPLQVTRGGPILMVQAENEYGFFGKDAAYMGEIRQALLDAGFESVHVRDEPLEGLQLLAFAGAKDAIEQFHAVSSLPGGCARSLA